MATIFCAVNGGKDTEAEGLRIARELGCTGEGVHANFIIVDSDKTFEALRALLWERRISLGKLRPGRVNKDFKAKRT